MGAPLPRGGWETRGQKPLLRSVMSRFGRFLCLLALGLAGCAAELEPSTAPKLATQEQAGVADAGVEPEPVSSEATSVEVAAVDHVGLVVKDLAASTAFFVDGLGYTVRGNDPSYPAAFLSNGHSLITLWQVEDPDAAIGFDRRKNVGLHHLALSVTSFDALDALHERLSKMPGVRIEFAPELSYGGPAKHMMVFEPSGNRIELVHRPG